MKKNALYYIQISLFVPENIQVFKICKLVKSEALKPRLAHVAGAYPGFHSMKRLGVLLVHQFVRFPQQFAGTHLYSWVERGTVRVKCLAQELNIMSPARDRTWTARSGNEHTAH